MENNNQNRNQKIEDRERENLDSFDKTSQSSEVRTNPDGSTWPKDETLDEFLEKDKTNSKMKPGQLDND